jgi:hypothetical protein
MDEIEKLDRKGSVNTDLNDRLAKKIKKSMSKSIKYLLDYQLRLSEEEKNKQIYDGGVSIMLNYIQGRYGFDLGFDKDCNNLVKCAQDYMITHPRPLFGYNKPSNDLFDTNFLRDIFLQKNNQYPLSQYIQKMEKYIQTGNGFINNILPILDIFSQRQIRYVNVGLGLFGLMEQNYEKVTHNKEFKHLKKRVCRELADIFNNKSNYDPLYLDTIKAYSAFLLHLLEEEDRIEEEDYKAFVICLLKTQNSIGNWIHSDNNDSVNEINNTMLTIFALINLLNYYKRITENVENTMESIDTIEGFEGGFLTQKNMDLIFSSKACWSTFFEIGVLIIMLIIFGYLMIRIYRVKNI